MDLRQWDRLWPTAVSPQKEVGDRSVTWKPLVREPSTTILMVTIPPTGTTTPPRRPRLLREFDSDFLNFSTLFISIINSHNLCLEFVLSYICLVLSRLVLGIFYPEFIYSLPSFSYSSTCMRGLSTKANQTIDIYRTS